MNFIQDYSVHNLSDVRREICAFYEDLLNTGLTLRVRVTGKSMEPFLRGNEILSVRKVAVSSLLIGDLILFKDRCGMPVLHRILKKTGNRNGQPAFCTKGDSLLAPDDTVFPEEVMGKVCAIETSASETDTRYINMESYLWRTINFLKALRSFGRAQIYLAGSKYIFPASLRSVFRNVFL